MRRVIVAISIIVIVPRAKYRRARRPIAQLSDGGSACSSWKPTSKRGDSIDAGSQKTGYSRANKSAFICEQAAPVSGRAFRKERPPDNGPPSLRIFHNRPDKLRYPQFVRRGTRVFRVVRYLHLFFPYGVSNGGCYIAVFHLPSMRCIDRIGRSKIDI